MFFNISGNYFLLFILLSMLLNIILIVTILRVMHLSKKEKKRFNRINDYLNDITKTVDSVRYGNLSQKISSFDIPNSENLTESLNRMIETLYDREKMVDEHHAELVKQNKIMEATINSLSDGLIITDTDGKILRTTHIITEWIGVDSKDLTGKHITDYMTAIPKRPLNLWNDSAVIVENNKNSNFIASTVELKIEDKKNRYIVILKNVTDQKELETLKEDFVATLTHDLKVPIVAETNMIELFLNETFGKISEKQKIALKNMQSSNKELLELVQIVLETYKVGKITLYKDNIMLKSFLEEIIEEMKPIADKSQNTIKLNLKRDIRVFADKFQLTRVIKNLIQNAILYGNPKTPIEISTGEIPDYVVIKVKDHGAGISKSDLEKIFNKYYSASKKFRKIGTGLGLYLAYQIIKAHNGELAVESVEGKYTEFCIKLPVKSDFNL